MIEKMYIFFPKTVKPVCGTILSCIFTRPYTTDHGTRWTLYDIITIQYYLTSVIPLNTLHEYKLLTIASQSAFQELDRQLSSIGRVHCHMIFLRSRLEVALDDS